MSSRSSERLGGNAPLIGLVAEGQVKKLVNEGRVVKQKDPQELPGSNTPKWRAQLRDGQDFLASIRKVFTVFTRKGK